MTAGAILINEPMSNRYDLGAGDSLLLQTDRGPERFDIAGISVDFDVNAVVYMHDPVYRGLWEDGSISAIGAFVEEGKDVDAVVAEVRSTYAGAAELLVRSNRGTRENALAVFDRTFAITLVLQLLATLVAFIGILSTLMSLQLERSREIGILRSTGMTRRQLWRLSLLGNRVDRFQRRAHCHSHRAGAGCRAHLHHQSAFVWLDPTDAGRAAPTHPAIPRSPCGRAVGRALSGLADRQHRAGHGPACRVEWGMLVGS